MGSLPVAPHAGARVEIMETYIVYVKTNAVAPHAGARVEIRSELQYLIDQWIVAPHSGARVEIEYRGEITFPVEMSPLTQGRE